MLPGTYRALADIVITRKRDNGLNAPTEIDSFDVEEGEEFEVPQTVNGFFYSGGRTEEEARIERAEFGMDVRATVERIG